MKNSETIGYTSFNFKYIVIQHTAIQKRGTQQIPVVVKQQYQKR